MKNTLKWFQERFRSSTHRLTVLEQNRRLMHDNLQMCYTKKHIERIKEVLLYMNDTFDVNQRISFTLEILYRERMIHYCNKKLKKELYTVAEFHTLLQGTTRYFQCDALLLHIEKYKNNYLNRRKDLGIYQRMVDKRKAFMLNEIEVVL